MIRQLARCSSVAWSNLGCKCRECSRRARNVRPVIRHAFSIRHRGAALEAPNNNIAGGLCLAERSEAQPLVARPQAAMRNQASGTIIRRPSASSTGRSSSVTDTSTARGSTLGSEVVMPGLKELLAMLLDL